MEDFEFELGAVVYIDPTGKGHGPEGRVIGQVRYIDGSAGYIVSSFDFARAAVARHQVASCEIHSIE